MAAAAEPVASPPLVLALHSPELRLRLNYLGSPMADPLELIRGSVAPVRIELRDANGPESVPASTRATLRVQDDAGGTVLDLDTDGGGLVQSVTEPHVYTATIDQATADALPLGTYVGQLNLEFAGGWIPTQRWFARIVPNLAPVLP